MTNATTKSLTQHPCSFVLGTQAGPALWNPGREGNLQIRASTGQAAFADDVNYPVRLQAVSPTAAFPDKR
jgi:hypothetical protein